MNLQESNFVINKLKTNITKAQIEKHALIDKISKKKEVQNSLKTREHKFIDSVKVARAQLLKDLDAQYRSASGESKVLLKKKIQDISKAGKVHDAKIQIQYKVVRKRLGNDIKKLYNQLDDIEKNIGRYRSMLERVVKRGPMLSKAGKVGLGLTAASGVALSAATYARYRKLEKERAKRLNNTK